MDQTQQALFSAISYSYIRTIKEQLEVIAHPLAGTIGYLDEEIASIIKEINTLFLALPQLIGAEETFKQEYATKLLRYRETLESKYRMLHATQRELQHITTYFNNTTGFEETSYEDFGMEEADAQLLDLAHIAKDCTDFVFQNKSSRMRQANAHKLLPFVPMRMTKESFLSYAEKSIAFIDTPDDPASITFLFSILSQLVDGRLYPGYPVELADLCASIEALRATTDADEFFQDAELLSETLDGLLTLVESLYRIICSFSNLLIFDGLTFETLTDMHVSFYDLYCSMKNILDGAPDKEVLLETLPERVIELSTTLEATYQKQLGDAEENALLPLIATYLCMEVSHVFGFDRAKEPTTSKSFKDATTTFIAQLKDYLTEQPVAERKLRMQYFMSILPFMMSEQTFLGYVSQGFKNVSSPKRNLFTAMYLTNLLEENDFFETPAAQDVHPIHSHHEHTHGEDCGCDHPHHH